MDAFQSLTAVFEAPVEYFFRFFADQAEDLINGCVYCKMISFRIEKIKMPKFPYSSIEAIYKLSQKIPSHSLLHLSILNSTRILQLFDLPAGVRVYSNLGTFGIDGSMSTFLGQAAVNPGLCFLIIGDLSFFYDINATGLNGIRNNVRILLINNGGAAEFHFSMGEKRIPTINRHIAAEHSYTAEAWLRENGFDYISVANSEELDAGMDEFTAGERERPVVLEVITRKDKDAEYLNQLFEDIKLRPRELPDLTDASANEDRFEKASLGEKIKLIVKKFLGKVKRVWKRR